MNLIKVKLILVVFIFSITSIFSQNQNSSENLDYDIITRDWFQFEPDENYSLEGSTFIIADNLKSSFYPNVPLFLNNEKKSENSLGIRASWDRISGDNYIDIIPESTPEINGNPNRISIWIWGNKTDAEFTAIFTRGDGASYVASLGVLDYKGWEKKITDLPSHIFRGDFNEDPNKIYKFDRFRIFLNHKKSKVNNLYFFIDQFTLSEEMTFINYDGFEIEKIIRKEIEENNAQ